MYAQRCFRTRSGTESGDSDRDCEKTGEHAVFERRSGGGIVTEDQQIEIVQAFQLHDVHDRLLHFSFVSPRTPTATFCGARASPNLCENTRGVGP